MNRISAWAVRYGRYFVVGLQPAALATCVGQAEGNRVAWAPGSDCKGEALPLKQSPSEVSWTPHLLVRVARTDAALSRQHAQRPQRVGCIGGGQGDDENKVGVLSLAGGDRLELNHVFAGLAAQHLRGKLSARAGERGGGSARVEQEQSGVQFEQLWQTGKGERDWTSCESFVGSHTTTAKPTGAWHASAVQFRNHVPPSGHHA